MECPEAIERGRNFRLLAEDELPQLFDLLEGYLPESLKFHQTVLTYMRDRVWEFHFYVANNYPDDLICLHFPGMTLSPHGLLSESVGIFCPNDRLDLMRLVRDEDLLINWEKPLYINFMHCEIANELIRLYEDIGNVKAVLCEVWGTLDILTLDDEPKEIVIETENNLLDVQVLPLKPEHAEGIHDLYPANDMECHEVFLRLIRTLPAGGVFVDGNLAAWMIQSYYGAMFSMQTKPEYRRKGYGIKLARYLTKRVTERGYRPFVVIRPENDPSKSLYTKLGFGKLYETVRATFIPFTWQDVEYEASHILRDNLENAVRQLSITRRFVNALREEDEKGTIEILDVDEEPEDTCVELKTEEYLETIEEQPEERIEGNEESPQIVDSNEGDGGTTYTLVED